MKWDITINGWATTHVVCENIIKNKFILFLVKLITKNEWIKLCIVHTKNTLTLYIDWEMKTIYKKKKTK